MNPNRLSALSDMERECLRLYWELGDAGEVATALNLSINTVRTHFRNARQKVGGDSTRRLARAIAAEAARKSLINQPLVIPASLQNFDQPATDGFADGQLRDSQTAAPWLDVGPAGVLEGGRRIPAVPLMTLLRDLAWQIVACVAAFAILMLVIRYARDLIGPDTFRL